MFSKDISSRAMGMARRLSTEGVLANGYIPFLMGRHVLARPWLVSPPSAVLLASARTLARVLNGHRTRIIGACQMVMAHRGK
jgi:hypothetical protein